MTAVRIESNKWNQLKLSSTNAIKLWMPNEQFAWPYILAFDLISIFMLFSNTKYILNHIWKKNSKQKQKTKTKPNK